MDSIMDNLPVECKTDTELLASYQNGLLPVELTENDDSHSDSKEKRMLTMQSREKNNKKDKRE